MSNILEVRNLKKYFETEKGMLHAVDNISFKLKKGKTLGIVGESGCGKSTTGRTLVKLIEATSGEILYKGEDITKLNNKEFAKYRNELQMIFQDPYSSLNPRKSVYQTIEEPLIISKKYKDKTKRHNRVVELMDLVGLAKRYTNAYPHELDGGRRQRIGIARALANDPEVIICDEPVSALDVSVQAQILNLLKRLQKELNISYIFITHDLGVVKHISDDIAVMYLGEIVEYGSCEDVFEKPLHPYTKALFSAIPIPKLDVKDDTIVLKGEISSPINPKDECRFVTRCIYATERCSIASPKIVNIDNDRFISCYNYKKI